MHDAISLKVVKGAGATAEDCIVDEIEEMKIDSSYGTSFDIRPSRETSPLGARYDFFIRLRFSPGSLFPPYSF